MSATARAPLGRLEVAASAVSAPFEGELPVTRPISWIGAVERRLREIETWKANWDKQDALPFGGETIGGAKQLLEQMKAFYPEACSAGVPQLVPLTDGSIRFELKMGQKELFLTVLGSIVEAQKWYPLDNAQSIDYAEVPVASGVRPALEWLTT
jgi:hypothetical protein